MVDAMADRRVAEIQPALLVAIESSKASWLLAVHDPTTDKISRHRIGGGDAAGLVALIGAARRVAGRSGEPVVRSGPSACSRRATMASGSTAASRPWGSAAG